MPLVTGPCLLTALLLFEWVEPRTRAFRKQKRKTFCCRSALFRQLAVCFAFAICQFHDLSIRALPGRADQQHIWHWHHRGLGLVMYNAGLAPV